MKTLFSLRLWALLAGLLLNPAAAAADRTILVWGDSISAGYGLDAGTGWVNLLERRLQTQGRGYRVVNASVSGETTAGGLSRLPAALDKFKPALVLLELGGNDGLRALPLDAMRANLEQMIELTRAARAQPVLFEMYIPRNYGPVYGERFTRVFGQLAQARRVPMVPFFLAPLVAEPDQWFQDDALHPNARAQPRLLDAVWPTLEPLLKPVTHP
ncbi:MAG TPA: arylesterase [Nevskia sp.]|jgi:acyl-CoA thioesterase-1|nr:arylesterase [Nevskia sp.]